MIRRVAPLPILALSVLLLVACGNDRRRGPTDGSIAVDSGTGRDSSTTGCDPACPTLFLCCGGVEGAFCRDPLNDPMNCGGCGISCAPGLTCVSGACIGGDAGAGSCTPACASRDRCCDGFCVGLDGSDVDPVFRREDDSFFNCGGCGLACDSMNTSECMPRGGTGAPECLCGGFPPCEAPTSCALLDGVWGCAAP